MRKLAGKCGNWRVVSTFKIGIIKKDKKLFDVCSVDKWRGNLSLDSCSNRSNISHFFGYTRKNLTTGQQDVFATGL